MTVRNVTIVSDWRTVLADGFWRAELGDRWDVSLVPGSPAIDKGPSGTPLDIIGMPRPQGSGADAGCD